MVTAAAAGAQDSHDFCPSCGHEYGYHNREGQCQKECCPCGSSCGSP